MFGNVASKAGLVGLSLLVGATGLEACSSSGGGVSPVSTGGTSSAGTSAGGTLSNAGTFSTGGTTGIAGTTSTGGTTGLGGSGGSGGSGGASAMGPFTCLGSVATCNSWTTFAQTTTNSWGTGTFTGGITVFGAGLTRDATSTSSIHVTGMVTGYGYGFGLFFTNCSNLSAFTGVSFKVKGTTDATSMLTFQLQTNKDYPFIQAPANMKGACVATDVTNPFGMCVAPLKSVPVSTTEATVPVLFTDLMGGMPVATAEPAEVVGLQWALPWTAASAAYQADITVSEVTLTGGTGTAASCSSASGGAGGGGAGGAGGTGGGAAGTGGGAGTGGTGGSGGSGGSGGTAGSGGSGGH